MRIMLEIIRGLNTRRHVAESAITTARIEDFTFYYFIAILYADHAGDHQRSKTHWHTAILRKESCVQWEIEPVYVNTEDQLADGMTKALQTALHRTCLETICHRIRLHKWWSDQHVYVSYVFFSMYWLILWLLCISLHVCKHLYILVAIFM